MVGSGIAGIDLLSICSFVICFVAPSMFAFACHNSHNLGIRICAIMTSSRRCNSSTFEAKISFWHHIVPNNSFFHLGLKKIVAQIVCLSVALLYQ